MKAARAAASSLVVAGLFVPQVVGGAYLGAGRALPGEFLVLSQLFLGLSLAVWFWSYCRRRGVWWAMDMGWFVLCAWIVVIPYFVLKREGRSGLGRLGLFGLIWFAAWATGWAVQVWTQLLGVPGE